MSPQIHVKALTRLVTVLEIGLLRRRLRLNAIVAGGSRSYRTGVPMRRGRDTRELSLPHENAVRSRPSGSQEERSHQDPTVLGCQPPER